LDIYPSHSNHTVGSIAKLLRDLESPLLYSCRQLFVAAGLFLLSQALLTGADMCDGSLLPPPATPVLGAPLPPVLNIQLIMHPPTIRTNMSSASFAMFERWSYKLRANDYPTLPLLMKSFMDVEKQLVIPQLIEEVPNFKAFVDGYLCSGNDALQGHTNAQQFKFYKNGNGWPLMQYKLWCTDSKWLRKENGGIRLWQETTNGRPKVPSGPPVPQSP
jgi:hypothetical protein